MRKSAAAAVHSYDHEGLSTIADVSETLLSRVEKFFIFCNKQRAKKFRITGTSGPKKAIKALKAAMNAKVREKEK
jgi:inorganic pyrophosphatase